MNLHVNYIFIITYYYVIVWIQNARFYYCCQLSHVVVFATVIVIIVIIIIVVGSVTRRIPRRFSYPLSSSVKLVTIYCIPIILLPTYSVTTLVMRVIRRALIFSCSYITSLKWQLTVKCLQLTQTRNNGLD